MTYIAAEIECFLQGSASRVAHSVHLQVLFILINELDVEVVPGKLSIHEPQRFCNCRDSVECLAVLETETDRLVA